MAALVHQLLDRPSLAAIEAGPHGAAVTTGRAVAVAVDQDVMPFHGQAREAGHAAVVGVLWTVGQHFAEGKVLPGMTSVRAGGGPAPARVGAFLGPVSAGVVIDCTVAQLGNRRLAGALGGEGLAGLPRLAAVITVNGVGVMLGPFAAMVLASVPAGRADQTALVFAVAQGDAVFVHVHGRRIAFGIGLDLSGNLLPRLAEVVWPHLIAWIAQNQAVGVDLRVLQAISFDSY